MDQLTHDDRVEGYLKFFGNDPAAAKRAIDSYITLHRQKKSTNRNKPTGKVLITAENVTKVYKVGRQKVSALNGVSLEIHEGEFVAITGSSGSGKSTLLQLLGGLEKPSSGRISIDGINVNKMSDRKLSQFRGQTIGFVFQFFYLQPFLNLKRNLEVPAMFAHSNRKTSNQRIIEMAEAVGLADRLRHLPKELSGGQIQRAAIARALINQPKVILADEPTGNLDSKNGAVIIGLFEKIRRDFGTAIVVVTHDYTIAAQADREIKLIDGVVVE